MALLLGPPGCGKTTLLLALAGMLDQSLKVTGEISYNGHPLEKFVPQKTSCYVRQHDLHIPEITVRETLDFSARCQGGGSRAELLKEIEKREEEAGIVPDSDLAAFMKAISVEGLNRSSQTDYIMKILGLDNCSNTTVGDAMRRGISGGEKKRVTLGEMIVGPSRVFFMDEISNGLDSSTTFQIVTCLQQSVHITESTLLVSLLQPAPEVFNLFDDIILMAEGIVMCQGPRDRVLEFFENCGFRCPERKSAADFLQEIFLSVPPTFYSASNGWIYDSIPGWLTWGFWTFPLAYAEIGITVNEFLAPRWRQKISSSNTSIGEKILRSRGLLYEGYFYWISVGALLGFIMLYNIVFTLALTYLRSPGTSRAMISHEKLSQLQGRDNYKVETQQGTNTVSSFLSVFLTEQKRERMVLPFEPLALSFQDVQYFVDKPLEMRNQGATHKRIQLLQDVTGVFRPGVLTALMGVSGAGKTTLFDVLSGRKTSGIIQGDIRIGGYPKLQETFSRISGYCEQNDIHSPHITVEETVILSAWLRLGPQIDQNTRKEFVAEVLKTIELDGIKDNLVGLLGTSGLSIEQRKRLTVAVELVANPSILFIDEPTTGLDARTAAIVMRAVKNIVDTGRTVVCTIHQPSIDIFESFDELLLIKKGGQIIYSGQLGWHSKNVIEYFEGILGVPKIRASYNPAAWMLEVTSTSVEEQLGIDFARIYKDSSLYRDTKYLVEQLSRPPPGSRKLQFSTRYSVNMWEQFKACVWKHYWSYWRSPDYNLKRILFNFFASLFFGFLFWQHGSNINREQDVFNIAGLIFSALNFQGINNAQSVQGFVVKDRLVLYRERFVGMYSSQAYSAAQLVVEIPYVIIQAAIYGIISYASVGFQWSTYKFIWYLATMFLTMLYYTYAGMAIMAMSPNTEVSIIFASYFFVMNNIFSGFLVPGPQIPKWWVWFYWICPSAWTLNALITSQYGDVSKEIEVFGERKMIKSFLKDYFGFQHEQLPLVATMLVAINLLFASLFVFCIAKLNFQRR